MKLKRIHILGLLAATIAAVVWFLITIGEPRYSGKDLTHWLNVAYYTEGPEQAEARDAIRHIGTNALRALLKMAMAHDSDLKTGLLERMPGGLRHQLGWRTESEKFDLAYQGFRALGPIAIPIVHELIALTDDKNPDIQSCAVQMLSAIGPSAEKAVPALIRHFNDQDINLQQCVRTALGSIHAQPELVVPLLLASLEWSNRFQANHISSIVALSNFQDASSIIVPALVRLQSDSDPATRACASNSLNAFKR